MKQLDRFIIAHELVETIRFESEAKNIPDKRISVQDSAERNERAAGTETRDIGIRTTTTQVG